MGTILATLGLSRNTLVFIIWLIIIVVGLITAHLIDFGNLEDRLQWQHAASGHNIWITVTPSSVNDLSDLNYCYTIKCQSLIITQLLLHNQMPITYYNSITVTPSSVNHLLYLDYGYTIKCQSLIIYGLLLHHQVPITYYIWITVTPSSVNHLLYLGYRGSTKCQSLIIHN